MDTQKQVHEEEVTAGPSELKKVDNEKMKRKRPKETQTWVSKSAIGLSAGERGEPLPMQAKGPMPPPLPPQRER